MKTKTNTRKLWGWDFLIQGKPYSITHNGRPVLILDDELPSQKAEVLRVVRLLNKAESK